MIEVLKQQFTASMPPDEKLNRTREFLQIMALKSLSDQNAFENIAFTGGTALRVLYDIRRFSEDLDFSLVSPKSYDFKELNAGLVRYFSLNNLAELYVNLGQYEQALALYQQTLAIREKILGQDHHVTVLSMNSLANVYEMLGQYDKALPLNQRVLTFCEEYLGPDHPVSEASRDNLAKLYQTIGLCDEALPLH